EHYQPPYVPAPIDSAMTAFRPLNPHTGVQTGPLPTLRAVGELDPAKIGVGSALSRVPLGYTPAQATPADARTRTLLHGQDLLPDSNVAGYLQPPPLLLTNLNSLTAFSGAGAFPSGNGTDPISVIRVRVAGVHGDDPLSRARIRAVAQEIARTTGLQVDETIGSSPNAATAAVRARRMELAVLAAMGWSSRSRLGVIIGELAVVGLVGGVAGMLVA